MGLPIRGAKYVTILTPGLTYSEPPKASVTPGTQADDLLLGSPTSLEELMYKSVNRL